MASCCHVRLRVQDRQSIGLRVGGEVGASLSLGGLLYDRAADVWEGPYEVVPTRDGLTLPTNGLRMADNLRVNPIPSNYGLITYDGSTITVS